MTTTITGACHCGNLSFELSTQCAPEDIVARACDCDFCRMHATRNWSDPDGRARIEVKDPAALSRYQFGLRAIDFLVCAGCGGYAGAILIDDDGIWSTLNLRLTDYRDVPEQAASYGAQSAEDRSTRRKRIWTPTELGGF